VVTTIGDVIVAPRDRDVIATSSSRRDVIVAPRDRDVGRQRDVAVDGHIPQRARARSIAIAIAVDDCSSRFPA